MLNKRPPSSPRSGKSVANLARAKNDLFSG